MKMKFTLIAAALLVAQQAQAISLSEASMLANNTSQGSKQHLAGIVQPGF